MDDLISREAVVKLLDGWKPQTGGTPYGAGYNAALLDVIRAIQDTQTIPAVEAEPVRHGRWEKRKEDALVHWDCTECGIGYLDDTGLDKLLYCPHCGAKMDG